jgi:hypothetical protein
VNATEGDSGSVAYSLVAGNLNKFAIDPLTGLVSTLQSLDREDQDRYVLTVQARDTPGSNALSSFAQVYNNMNWMSYNSTIETNISTRWR